MYPNPSYVDGLQAVVALSVYCYNNAATYMTYSGDPKLGAAQTEIKNSDQQQIGSVTYQGGARKGTLNLQYALATDETPGAANLLLPGYIVSFRGRYYVVGEVGTPIVKNEAIKLAVAVTELCAPFMAVLLSTLGQQLYSTFAASAGSTKSAAATGSRTGSTLLYSLETFGTPGSAAPTGFSISTSTGLITAAAGVPSAGTYDLRAVVRDRVTLADGTTDDVYAFGRWTVLLT